MVAILWRGEWQFLVHRENRHFQPEGLSGRSRKFFRKFGGIVGRSPDRMLSRDEGRPPGPILDTQCKSAY
jgi:hypothetical protein